MSSVLTDVTDTLDPSLPERFETDTHGPVFARLRRECPVHFCSESAYGPYWSVTRLDDILAVEADPARWSSDGNIIIGDVPEDFAAPAFATSDPPIHGRDRRAVAPATSASRMAELSPDIEAVIEAILDSLPLGQPFDWTERVAAPLTREMVAKLFDWPSEERDLLPYWCEVMTTTPRPGAVVETDEQRRAELAVYRARLIREWHERAARSPARDIISCLAHAPSTAGMINNPDRLVGTVSMIAGANEAALGALAGGALAFQLYPEEWEKLRAEPGLAANAASEIVRWQSPILHMRRTAACDTELGGQRIRKGERVVMWYCSGNRDEVYFPDGDAFRLERANLRRHVGYGFGIHRCFGRHVAELELRLLWQAAARRFSRIEVLAPPVRYRSNFASGYRNLMVRTHPV